MENTNMTPMQSRCFFAHLLFRNRHAQAMFRNHFQINAKIPPKTDFRAKQEAAMIPGTAGSRRLHEKGRGHPADQQGCLHPQPCHSMNICRNRSKRLISVTFVVLSMPFLSRSSMRSLNMSWIFS
jgi:hypothetical protein